MRAIDADKLYSKIKDLEEHHLSFDESAYDSGVLDTTFEIRGLIEREQTITDIPKATLKQLMMPYLKKLEDQILDKFQTEDPFCRLTVSYYDLCNLIDNILEDENKI